MELRWISLLAVSLLVVAPTVPARSATVSLLPYEGSAPLTYQGLAECDAALPLGVVCLEFDAGDRRAAFHLDDATGLAVGGTWWVHDAQGAIVLAGEYCGGASVPLDPDVGTLVVRIDTVNGPVGCLADGRGGFGPATKGVVELVVQ